MAVKTVTQSQKKALSIATVIALLFGAYFLRDYFTMFVLAGVIGYTFSPVYKRFLRKMSRGSAASLTLVVALLAVVVPVTIIVLLCVAQLTHLAGYIGDTLNQTDVSKLGDQGIDFVNDLLDAIPFVDYKVTQESITDGLTKVAHNVGGGLLAFMTSSLTSVFGLITSSIIFIYVFLSLLINYDKIIALFKDLNPLGEEASELYVKKTAAMVRGTVGGQFVIAICQGVFGALTIYIAGVHQAFFVFVLVLSLLSMIPLGSGIVTIPIGIVMMLFGNIWGGLLVVLGHIIVVTNIDNVLRPRLVPKEARLDSALMLVSVFAGLAMFGFLGIVIGPVIMILIVTTIQTYLKVNKTPQVPSIPKKAKA